MTTNQRTRTCCICEQEFTHVVRAGTQPRYCSDKCRRSASWQNRQEKRRSVTELRCPRCGETKPVAEFAGVTHSYCRPCVASYHRVMRANRTPEQKAYYRLWDTAWRHSITVPQLLSLLASQDKRCAICRLDLEDDARRWHVDHDHGCCPNTSGDGPNKRQRGCGRCIRGILCGNCNAGLGMFRDTPALLRAAAAYLEASNTPQVMIRASNALA